MNGEACCQDRRAVHPGIVFFQLRQRGDLGLFDVPKNSGFRWGDSRAVIAPNVGSRKANGCSKARGGKDRRYRRKDAKP